MPVLIRHLWQLKTVVFLHWCLIDAILLQLQSRPNHQVYLKWVFHLNLFIAHRKQKLGAVLTLLSTYFGAILAS
jgi:hypothetical protein